MRRGLVFLSLCALVPSLATNVSAAASSSFTTAMESAAQSRGVPLALIQAVAYVNSRWEWIGSPAGDGGVGPMHILPSLLAQASSLSGHSSAEIAGDLVANLDAGAALLANSHTGGSDLASWRDAVIATQGPVVAMQIYDAMRAGESRMTSTGETITLDPQALPATSTIRTGVASPSQDYPPPNWVPADPNNFTVADRPHDYRVDMVVIHDIEGSYGSAIQAFQDPNRLASAHFVVSDRGDVTQMVLEKDVAWHAGNWDYNTRAIGIEHEGYAWTPGWYTPVMYQASAHITASICSLWGVPMDRTHVIGHNEVPDPDNPGLFGGADHHTDPGPYWDWTYYMSLAQSYAAALPSLPHMMPDPVAAAGNQTATVTWEPARSCHSPITGYQVVAQPGGMVMNLPASATKATFTGLQDEVGYSFTVTATNAEGQDSLTTNTVFPGRCTSAGVSAAPTSPQTAGSQVQLTAGSTVCLNPLYRFWMQSPDGTWKIVQDYSTSKSFRWNTTALLGGTYRFSLWVRDSGSPTDYDEWTSTYFTLTTTPCTGLTSSASPPSTAPIGTPVTVSGTSTGCPNPLYRFYVLPPGGSWAIQQDFSNAATFSWATNGKAPGTYRFSVWVRDSTSPAAYDAYRTLDYNLAVVPCAALSATSSPPGSATVGATVAINGSATGCKNPSYRFWVLPPGGSWTMLRDYAATSRYDWSTSGQPAGTYRFSVWARDGSSSASYDVYSTLYLTLNSIPCTAVNVSSSPLSTARVGAPVTINAGATGCPAPSYRFYIQGTDGTWTMVQDYSTSAAYSWSTTGLNAGKYRFSVWARDATSSASYDVYNTEYFTLN